MSTTSAFLVVPPAGMDASTQSRSTPNGELLVPVCGMAPDPCVQLAPWFTDFHTSACSGATPSLPARLHRYTAPDWSVSMQSSPLWGSAAVTWVHELPPLLERYVRVPPCGAVSYSTPRLPEVIHRSPPYAPAVASVVP